MNGTIISLSLNKERGFIKHQVKEVTLKENHGVVGDGHAGTWHKQVSLVGLESYKKMEAEDNKEYPYHRGRKPGPLQITVIHPMGSSRFYTILK